jgi:RimJ/RimL family protein N-acetyltransferase
MAGGMIDFRPLAPADLPMLLEWLRRPHVARWWQPEPTLAQLEQNLADGERLGQGLGSRMVGAFVERLFQDPAVSSVQTDPSPDNARAIRCYRRAGFVDQGVVDTPDGPALLMLQEKKQ